MNRKGGHGLMRRFIAVILSCALVLTGCTSPSPSNSEVLSTESSSTEKQDMYVDISEIEQEVDFENLNDPKLLTYVENTVYTELIKGLDSEEYFVENVEAIYYSKEYLEELAYNSQSNIYFEFTLEEINECFEGEKYVFTLGDEGQTVVQSFEKYDDTYEQALKNVATGAGVIFICVTVSVLTGGSAPAVSMIFAASAKTGTVMALSSGVLGSIATGVAMEIETEDFEETMKAMVLSGSEGFKWGAFTGVLSGGIAEGIALKGATLNGLSMNQAAAIQMESKYPVDVIKQFKSMEQYEICKNAGLTNKVINGRTALVRDIDLNYIDEATGMTNLELMLEGKAPIDPASGAKYQLHHIGQKADSTLAILTEAEHKLNGNHTIWHDLNITSEVHTATNNWDAQRIDFWKTMGKMYAGYI